jgi:hypothetical protein
MADQVDDASHPGTNHGDTRQAVPRQSRARGPRGPARGGNGASGTAQRPAETRPGVALSRRLCAPDHVFHPALPNLPRTRVAPRPEGPRVAVAIDRACAVSAADATSGNVVLTLPAGAAPEAWARSVLDCVLVKAGAADRDHGGGVVPPTLWIVDVIEWGGVSMALSDARAREFWVASKVADEAHEAQRVRFAALPWRTADPEGLAQCYSDAAAAGDCDGLIFRQGGTIYDESVCTPAICVWRDTSCSRFCAEVRGGGGGGGRYRVPLMGAAVVTI